MGLFGPNRKKNSRATRVRKMQSKINKLEKQKALRQKEEQLKKKLTSLRGY